MRDGDKLPYWPAMMLRKTAMAYCDMSEAAFLREVATGTFPDPVQLGPKQYWSRKELDKAIGRLFGDCEIDGYDWRQHSPLYADDPLYHPELRRKKGRDDA